MIFGGRYVNEKLMPANLNVNIMVDICTFKREEYVYRNLNLLKEQILENPESPLYRHLYVHISDNAKTLDTSIADGTIVKVSPNKNAGGVGGFTRGIIEAMSLAKQRDISHVLLMDDDAMIEPASLEVTYSFLSVLKEEYQDYTLAGSIIQLNKPYLQYEEGAQWNQGAIEALKHKVDLREVKVLLLNEDESEKVEYAGWWYCCIPLSVISKENLPLPLFIHRDDVEYGLRTGKERFIYMNRICIWHEAFAGKMPGPLDYYDIRNHCITNAIHCPEYTKEDFKKFFSKWVWGNIGKYRYKYVDYNVKAVEDFCKGIDWLLDTDAFLLHQELFAMNYKAKPIEEWVGFEGLTKEQLEARERGFKNPGRLRRRFHILTANGCFFPPKGRKVVISEPYGNVHILYRRPRTIVVDSYGNGLYLERDKKKFWECKRKLDAALKLIDEKYDAAAKSYHDRYKELVSTKFWEKYLGL